MRSHASHVYSGNHSAGGGGVYGSRSEDDGGSDKFEDVHGVTKTVSYTVRREQSYDSSRGNVKNGLR